MEKKIHLRGLSKSLCGRGGTDRIFSSPTFAGKYSEVSCRQCMNTENYTRYLEGRYKEKPETYEQDIASGYYQTGKLVAWLQKLVNEFNPQEALELVNQYNGSLRGNMEEVIEIPETDLLKMMSNTWALLAINKKLGNGDPLVELTPLISVIARAKVLTEELTDVLKMSKK